MIQPYLDALRAVVGEEKYPLALTQLRGLARLLTPQRRSQLTRSPDNEKRAALLDGWCGEYVAREVKNTVALISERGELDALDDLADPALPDLRDTAVVTTARPLTEEEKSRVIKALPGADRVIFRENRDLIGGVKIKLGDREIDNSLRTRLNACFSGA